MPYTASAGVVANNTFFSSSNGKTGSIISNHDLIRDTISLDYRLFFNRQKNLRPVSVASKPSRFIFVFLLWLLSLSYWHEFCTVCNTGFTVFELLNIKIHTTSVVIVALVLTDFLSSSQVELGREWSFERSCGLAYHLFHLNTNIIFSVY